MLRGLQLSPMPVNVDVAIFGGGIAGLWTLALARARGLSAVLFESARLGTGQTIASQGIIHGGVKYALGGLIGDDSKAIAGMPQRWRAALRGEGEVDLRAARVLSDSTYLWTTGGLGAKVMGIAASKAIRSAPEKMERSEWPEAFRDAPRGVDVYRVSEPVLDVASVLEALRGDDAIAYGACRFEATARGIDEFQVECAGCAASVRAERVVFAAGHGNRAFLGQLASCAPSLGAVRTQERPLTMVMVKCDLPELFGHAIGASHRPLITVTTARDQDGRTIWYVGGQVAEAEGDLATVPEGEFASSAHKSVAAAIPWVRLDNVHWARWEVSRAEAATPDGRKPEGPVIHREGNLAFCWPTKLAFAPLVAEQALAGLEPRRPGGAEGLERWPRAAVAEYPWQQRSPVWT